MDKISLKEKELVLKVNKNVDITKWDESKYDKFIEKLTKKKQY